MIENKKKFRENCIDFLYKAQKYNKKKLNNFVLNYLKNYFKTISNRSILVYNPFGFEVDISSLIPLLKRNKNKVYSPFMVGQSFKMVNYRLPLFKAKFGIKQSKNSFKDIKKINYAIVPVVGIDGNYKRIGFGKGMYDRFFAKLKSKPIIIFVQLDYCFTKTIVSEVFDIQADIVVAGKYNKIIRK